MDLTWHGMSGQVDRWHASLAQEGLQTGDRVAVMLRNCPEWVMFDQAAMALGLVVVPLYVNDRPENITYILNDAGVKLLLLENAAMWRGLSPLRTQLDSLSRVLILKAGEEDPHEALVVPVSAWLTDGAAPARHAAHPDDLATIVYTSGTTGRPKGVMLSHHNILWNAHSVLRTIQGYREDVFLSFLPLAHTYERTVGYYLPMMCGACVAYARSIQQLLEDIVITRPTVMLTVPRIFEAAYGRIQSGLASRALLRPLFGMAVEVGWHRFLHRQGRSGWHWSIMLWPILERLVARRVAARFGGRIRIFASGAAPLDARVAKWFLGLGLPVSQGYGMTEASPVVSGNPLDDNDPASVGVPLQDVQVRIGANDELLVRSPGVMLGYWNDPQKTLETVDEDGWLHTGDQARIEHRHLFITGRIKEIIVLANGEKVPPDGLETALILDTLIQQVMVVGEGRPYLAALAVLDPAQWQELASAQGLDPEAPSALQDRQILRLVLQRANDQLAAFPRYARIRRIHLMLTPWTVEEGLITPSMKLKRHMVMERFRKEIDAMYANSKTS